MKMIKTTTLACIGISLILAGAAQASPVPGPGTIAWKGLTWTVDANATAEVNTDGNLEITVGNDTGDPAADNWNVHANLSSLFSPADYARGVWVEFSFLDAGPNDQGAFGGGPRAYLDTWEERNYELDSTTDDYNTEYMFQGGMYDGYADYYVNHATYVSGSGWNESNWYFPGGRTEGEHTFKALLDGTAETVDLWYDGVYMGQLDGPASVPTLFETAYLGVTSNGLAPGDPGFGVYTDFQTGVVPAPAAVFAGMGLLGALGLRRRRA